MINIPGYYNLPLLEYLSDPAPEPSISKGTVLTLVQSTPHKARMGHPRLGSDPSAMTSRGDLGSAVHSMALGGHDVVFAPEEFQDWRKKEAQAFRDNAREAGQLPLLARQRADIGQSVAIAKDMLASCGEGITEQSILFQLEGVWFRGRADYLTDTHDVELKTCDNADPATWVRRTVQSSGYAIQMGLRSLGHKAMGKPRIPRWLLLEVETKDPDACFVEPSARMIEQAEAQCLWAAKLWRKCLDSGEWPRLGKVPFVAEPTTSMGYEAAERCGIMP